MMYNPSRIGTKGTLFGLPFGEKEASIVILPIPWEATVSYNEGTAQAPHAILAASSQLDLELPFQNPPWKKGIWMAPASEAIQKKSRELRHIVRPYLKTLEQGHMPKNQKAVLEAVHKGSTDLNRYVKEKTACYLRKGKKVGLLGGDHSCPLGYIETLAKRYHDFGILQIDAHMDLRRAYEGFEHSHASIMYHALQNPQVSRLVQVGVRDYCEEEMTFVRQSNGRVIPYFDRMLSRRRYESESWGAIGREIIQHLPAAVYVSFDVDGLDPSLCPGTGTPVPGGLSFSQAVNLLHQLKQTGKEVIGFDLCEVAPQPNDREWNANVAARILYDMCAVL